VSWSARCVNGKYRRTNPEPNAQRNPKPNKQQSSHRSCPLLLPPTLTRRPSPSVTAGSGQRQGSGGQPQQPQGRINKPPRKCVVRVRVSVYRYRWWGGNMLHLHPKMQNAAVSACATHHASSRMPRDPQLTTASCCQLCQLSTGSRRAWVMSE
jgi:hypothetical protein